LERYHMTRLLLGRALLLLTPLCLGAQNLAEFEKKVTEFTLGNGLHFIVLERHDAPIVSMITMVNVGSANDVSGATGLAHMFEHMAFKGNDVVGTKDFAAEKKAMVAVEAAYDKLEAERRKGPRADKELIKKLEAELKAVIEKANSYSDSEAYSRTISENGGVGMNAGTSVDTTTYFYSLPANRLELWALLTSKQLRDPIMREFYKERDVVREERRMRFESSPQGEAQELLMETAFLAHPYRSLIGFGSDLENLRAHDAEAFFRKYYVPSNMVIAVAGDVKPAEVKRLADTYFATIPSGQQPPDVVTVEPKQNGERRVAVETVAQPFVIIGYKRPSETHPDDPVCDVIGSILSSGRTGMLYKDMVRDKKLALAAGSSATFPGGKFPNLFFFYALPSAGKSLEDNEKEIYAVIEKLKFEKVDEATLQRVKTKVRAGLIRQLDSAFGMAYQLASAYTSYGDWKKVFTAVEDINKVTADDVQRVAKEYFIQSARTVVFTQPKQEAKAAKGGAE
jgi:predicted Zn-dependent peptidase